METQNKKEENDLTESEECLSTHSSSSLDSFWENIFTDDGTAIDVDDDQYEKNRSDNNYYHCGWNDDDDIQRYFRDENKNNEIHHFLETCFPCIITEYENISTPEEIQKRRKVKVIKKIV